MAHRLWVLDPLSVPLARPHPDLLTTDELVVADPHDGLRAMVGSAHAVIDHPPAPAGLGEDGRQSGSMVSPKGMPLTGSLEEAVPS